MLFTQLDSIFNKHPIGYEMHIPWKTIWTLIIHLIQRNCVVIGISYVIIFILSFISVTLSKADTLLEGMEREFSSSNVIITPFTNP